MNNLAAKALTSNLCATFNDYPVAGSRTQVGSKWKIPYFILTDTSPDKRVMI